MSEHPDPLRTAPEDEGQLVAPAPPAALPPARIGRYRVERLLGQGGFGLVYLAHDEQLGRPVAIKTPHARLVVRAGDAAAYLAEARTVANLDHPNIVPVYDVGGDDQFPCYVVSKYIDGIDLAAHLKQSRLSLHEAVEITATVAEALHHAHKQGLVHRDVKPGNILLGKSGKSFVADFGLALREQDVGKGPRFAGTPAYMSPEQARGEGHRVDGRSDIFSLGVVFYELLVGRQPFGGDSREELLEQIASFEARPPRQFDDHIPKELDRICLKALSKRASERYSTAQDLADDLRCFVAQQTVNQQPTNAKGGGSPAIAPVGQPPSTPVTSNRSVASSATPATPTSDNRPIKIVPKGLRSFDAGDADFFLELLPGPRDRDGLPDSIRFWKTRIEERDPDNTFAVGLIYGPSGCGKSSLVKAGLLPRLSKDVIAVYVEATTEETESRLLNGLRKRCQALSGSLSLKETLAALRRGQGIPADKKVLIVLDQFEQWLHAKKEEDNTDLVQALRQCDGGRVQCVVMVRDDFWMAATRFMRELEIRLVEAQNSAAVDVFPIRHAEKVLKAFGRAFGALPDASTDASQEQKQFLERAVSDLAQEGKVISVRLALFAEMMKDKTWTPSTLKEVGGTEGVGGTFLEETFSANTAPPEHRYHQKAARAVLKALLPESGSDIKGHMRSHAELLAASGYVNRPKDFDDLIRILDSEIRLLTPTDPEGQDEASGGRPPPDGAPNQGASAPCSPQRFYQLTHDYLVQSLRDWLTRKQKETRRGRAELLLADRAIVWNARPENRQLPSLSQWFSIRLRTAKKNWTPPQRKLMSKAGRYHFVRGLTAVVVLLLLIGTGWEVLGRLRAQALMDNLLRASTEDVPAVVKDMGPYRRWLDGPLHQAYAEAEAKGDARKQLHASLALLPVDDGQVEYLHRRLLAADPQEVIVLREALQPHAGTLGEPLWAVLEDAKADPGQRLRAACALAAYAPDDGRWDKVGGYLAGRLAAENALVIGQWARALKLVGPRLLPPLAALLLEEKRSAESRRTITGVYAGYAEGAPNVFAPLEDVLAEQGRTDAALEKRLALTRRQANAAAALAALGRWEKVQRLLRHSPDPTLRSYLIDRLAPGGAEVRAVIDRLSPEQEPDVSARRALLLALGEFDEDRLPLTEREALVPHLLELYRTNPDAGTHGAVGWLLRHWGRQRQVEAIDQTLRGRRPPEGRHWYVNGQRQTLVLVPPGEFRTYSPQEGGKEVTVRVERRLWLAAREVTVAEFRSFRADHPYVKNSARTEDCPVNWVRWCDAAAYCNWLSKEEGMAEDQWCYTPNEKGEYAEGMKVKANALSLSGYRMPTEAEWELACRAGSVTPWSMGAAEDLLGKYAWFNANSLTRSRPVGSLRPNDLGLFDMHGNDLEWCQNRFELFPDIKDQQEKDNVDAKSKRVLRGSSFFNQPSLGRSFSRYVDVPTNRSFDFGFRPARTFTP